MEAGASDTESTVCSFAVACVVWRVLCLPPHSQRGTATATATATKYMYAML